MASKKKKNTAVTVISCVLLVLIVLGAVGLLLRFTNGFTEDFKSFYLVHDGERILNKQNQLLLGTGEEQSFEVHYTFEAVMDKPPNGYSVRIVPRATAETDFEFTVDGAKYLYSGEKDLTKAFDLVEDEDFFTLTIPPRSQYAEGSGSALSRPDGDRAGRPRARGVLLYPGRGLLQRKGGDPH